MSWLAVAIGGAIGASARYGLHLWLTPPVGKFPWATFSANVVGCCLIGVFYCLLVDKSVLPSAWRPFLFVGVLGAFTTFSTFSLEALVLWQLDHHWLAVSYVLSSVILCIIAVWLGYSVTATFAN